MVKASSDVRRRLTEWSWVVTVGLLAVGIPAGYRSVIQPPPTDLVDAADAGDLFRINVLLDRGTDANARADNGRVAVVSAVRSGNRQAVELLLARGARVNESEPGIGSALHMAVAGGHTDLVQFLLARGADVNQRSDEGAKPLDYAVAGGYAGIVRLLLAAGADPNAPGKCNPFSYLDDSTPAIVDALLDFGADPTRPDADGVTPMQILKEQGATRCLEVIDRRFRGDPPRFGSI